MEEKNKVSIWIGKSKSEIELSKYTQEIYNDDGEMFSEFAKDFKIEFYDSNFIEVLFTDVGTKEVALKDFSYSESFIKDVSHENFKKSNSFILLYNFKYDKSVNEKNNFTFIGTFDYN